MIAPLFRTVFRKDRVRSQAETLYAALAAQSRAPEFYRNAGAPDTPEGRFDLLSLHMALAIDRLRADGSAADRPIRLLQEIFFESLDSALREMGVGDLAVGRKIRGLAEAFYGRFSAYERAFGEENGALEAAIARNVLGTNDADKAKSLAAYARAARDALRDCSVDELAGVIAGLGALSHKIIAGDVT